MNRGKSCAQKLRTKVWEKYGVQEGKRRVYKSKGEEPPWTIKKVDYKHMKVR